MITAPHFHGNIALQLFANRGKEVDMQQENLNDYFSAYSKNFEYYLDNDLILNWYPQRIMQKTMADSSILELGLGHGFSTTHFADYYQSVTVIDGSSEIIEEFRKSNPCCPVTIKHCFFEEYEEERLFDIIIMGFILEHVDSPKNILEKFKQFLKPDGKLFLTVPNVEALNKRLGLSMGLIDDLFALGPGDIALGHKQLFSINTLRELSSQCGFKELSVEGLFLKPLTTKQLSSLNLDQKAFTAMMEVGIKFPELSVGIMLELTHT